MREEHNGQPVEEYRAVNPCRVKAKVCPIFGATIFGNNSGTMTVSDRSLALPKCPHDDQRQRSRVRVSSFPPFFSAGYPSFATRVSCLPTQDPTQDLLQEIGRASCRERV